MAQRLNIANIDIIRGRDPHLAEALESIAQQVASVADQTTATLHGSTPAPSSPSSLSVSAAGGIFRGVITDNSPAKRGIQYFVEYSDNPSFVKPYVMALGPSRNFDKAFGNQTLYFRAYSSYPTSPRSDVVYHGGSATAPAAVVGGGSTTGPALPGSQGSGTADGANGGDGGFGLSPLRNNSPQVPQ